MAAENTKPSAEYGRVVDKDFTDRIDAFNAGGLAQQSQEVSNRASLAVMQSIRDYPQNNDGAPWILASRALRYEFYPSGHSSNRARASMMEIARMVPDIELCGQEVDRTHDAYEVVAELEEDEPPRSKEAPDVTPARAAGFVCNFALLALSKIQTATLMFMRDRGLPTEGLDGSLRLDRAIAVGPWEINMDVVERIHSALSGNEDLRREVYKHVSSVAQPYIEGSAKQQAQHSPVAARRLANLAARDERKAMSRE